MLSLTTITILAWAKIIGFAFVFVGLYFIWSKKSVNYWLYATALAIILFFLVLSRPLQTMFWGNVGDELLILAYLSKTLLGNLGHDFYYDWLPQFYPPLYFWLTGIFAKPFAVNAIGAAKVGVLGTLFVWLLGAYFYQKIWWQRLYQNKLESILEKAWFWFLYPILYFLSLDFANIIFKPYEAISALFGVMLLAFFARAIWQKNWPRKYYLFFAISVSLVFLTFYFWFVILIPTAFFLIVLSNYSAFGGIRLGVNLKRILKIFLLSLPLILLFVGPLVWSYFKYGIENGQATHFVAEDFFSFMPWQNFSLQSLLFLLGLISLFVFYKKSAIKSMALVVILSFAYQIFNLILFGLGFKPVQASKPFYFLTSAALIFAASYLLVYFYQKYENIKYSKAILSIIFILLSGLLPHFSFIEKPEVLKQIEADLVKSKIAILADDLKNIVPDYQKYTWLSSGSSELNAYLPLSYYLANSVHFSHHAVLFSQRLDKLKKRELSQEINALLLYDDGRNSDDYILNFWVDNYPNGGKTESIYLAKSLFSENDWRLLYAKNNWLIFLKK